MRRLAPSAAKGRLPALLMALVALLFAAPALATPVALRPDLSAAPGRVTLGDLFDGAGPAAEVVVASGGQAGGSLILDAAEVRSVAAANGLEWPNSSGLRRLIVQMIGPSPAGPAAQAARGPARPAEVLALARNFRAGELIGPQDLVWTSSAPYTPPNAPRDPREVIGQAPRRPMAAGAVLSLNDLTTPTVIRKDDVVQVAYEAGGIRLVLEGRALGSASVGQAVDVLNPASKKTIAATASGPDQAVVGPAADRLKNPAPKLLASLP